MSRLSKAQISRQNAAKKGGRGRKKQAVQEPPQAQVPIETPPRPRTIALRHKSKAAAAERALHTAALIRIQLSSSVLSSQSSNSRPSTAGPMTRPSTGQWSTAATVWSIESTLI